VKTVDGVMSTSPSAVARPRHGLSISRCSDPDTPVEEQGPQTGVEMTTAPRPGFSAAKHTVEFIPAAELVTFVTDVQTSGGESVRGDVQGRAVLHVSAEIPYAEAHLGTEPLTVRRAGVPARTMGRACRDATEFGPPPPLADARHANRTSG